MKRQTKMSKLHLDGETITIIDMIRDKTGKTRSEILCLFLAAWMKGEEVKP